MNEAMHGNPPHAGGPQQQRDGGGSTTFDEGKIFLGGLAHSTTKATLEEYCRQWYAHFRLV